jgi:hypothetical protein
MLKRGSDRTLARMFHRDTNGTECALEPRAGELHSVTPAGPLTSLPTEPSVACEAPANRAAIPPFSDRYRKRGTLPPRRRRAARRALPFGQRFIFGAPAFAPWLFADLAVLAALGLWSLSPVRKDDHGASR